MLKIACVILVLIAAAGCMKEPQTISGTVVDGSGAALSDVVVTACYSGWGWSNGSLVWDKDYCSEPVLTDEAGFYVINFDGASGMRLRIKKEGWIQTQDFNTKAAHVFLTNIKENSARQAAEARLREENFRQRLADESDTEYYCRVILPRGRSIVLQYQDETLSITSSFFKYGDHSAALFAVHGSATAVSAFSSEVVLRIGGQPVNSKFTYRSAVTTCNPDVHFIEATTPGLYLEADERLEILVPSARAMFDMKIWRHSVKQ